MNNLAFEFPMPLAEKYRPHRIADFVGLDKPKRILSKFTAHPYQSAWLFVGPPGTGKTSMALAIAEALKAEIHHIGSQQCRLDVLEETARCCNYVPLQGGFHIVICDEADAMSDAAQKYLLSKLDSSAPVPNTIWIFTANQTDRLEARFLSRCRTVEFSSYGIASEATRLLESIWHRETSSPSAPNFARVVKESSNNIRDALMSLETELLAS